MFIHATHMLVSIGGVTQGWLRYPWFQHSEAIKHMDLDLQ